MIYVSPDRVINEFLDELDNQGQLLAAAAATAGPAAPVPSCPGWCVGDLLRHTGAVHRWAADIVGTPHHRPPPASSESDELTADVPDAQVLDWFTAGHATLVTTLRAAPDDLDCWTFLPGLGPKAFWARRQAHETAIHRTDAELAAGTTPTPVPAAFGADGIDELLRGFLSRRRGRLRADPTRTVLVRATDAGRAWLVTISAEPLQVSEAAGPTGPTAADLTITGPAAGLYLLLWNRCEPAGLVGLELAGDTGLLDLWRELACVT